MKDLKNIKNIIDRSKKITILSGAGMSTESGIPDFRSPGGVWSKYKTVTIQEFLSDTEKRKYYWRYKADTIPAMLETEPNPAHHAIGNLDKQGKLFYLLTQNIDGLHERGGVRKEKVINMHGTNSEAICLSCREIYDIREILKRHSNGDADLRCDKCEGHLKPNTVSFGQNLNPEHLEIAEIASRDCDLFMALGSSLRVYPACGYVETAHSFNRTVIIINRDSTPYDDIADYTLSGSLAEILPMIVE